MFKIVKDGVVGHWARWHLLGAAWTTLAVYIVYAIFWNVMKYFDQPVFDTFLDPRLLLITIPWGILNGDKWYEKDRLANETKPAPLFEEKK